MKVAVGQMNIVAGGVDENYQKGLSLIKKAKEKGSNLILLPEVWTTGFLFKRLKELSKTTPSIIEKLKKESNGLVICGSYVVNNPNDSSKVFNKFYAIYNGEIIFEYTKTMLFGVTGEDKYFSRGDINQKNIFSFNGIPFGVSICYELRFPEFFRRASFNGALIHLHPAIWPMSRLEHWLTLTRARAIENQVYFLCSNGVGMSGKWELAGNSIIYDPWGEMLQNANSKTDLKYIDIDFNVIEKARNNLPSLNDSIEFFK